ncbi:Hypothetical protein GLP15_1713 [Giardia lamblia P15]|uniref:FHA domain-containing protein n=1 Tax=Giardia intestinalis (strain P15) TaxID=658858 RepID=E1EW32_GIAIA|nr:Hypothetical protein GLP15_1713 [Giardia lamblia P15]
MEALAFLRGPAGYIALHKPIIVVGRSADCDISLDSRSISGHHAKILLEGPKNSAVIDLNSRNGTYINDIKIKNDSVPVYPGDALRFGTDLPPFRLEFSVDKAIEPLSTPKASEDTPCAHQASLEHSPTLDALTNTEKVNQGANTWFSHEDLGTEDCPILNIAQQEYKAAISAARSVDCQDEDLSELTIPSQCAVLEHSHSQQVRPSELSAFLQKVDDRLGALPPTREAASKLVADLLAEVRTIHCPETRLLESIFKRLDSLLEVTIDIAHASFETQQVHNETKTPDGELDAPLPSILPSVPMSGNLTELISSLQRSLLERDKYELQLLARLTDYKTAVSLLQDDLFNYLKQQSSAPDSMDRTLSASFVELKLNEHLLSEEVRRLRATGEDHLSLTETIDLLNQRIYNLLSENAALENVLNGK